MGLGFYPSLETGPKARSGWVDAVLVSDDLPELCADLVAAPCHQATFSVVVSYSSGLPVRTVLWRASMC